MRFTLPAAIAFTLFSTLTAESHEFWISPERYQIDSTDQMIAALRVGSDFKGASYAYLPPKITRFEIVRGGAAAPVEGRIGDRPALNIPAGGAGLAVIVHETTDYIVRYDAWEVFQRFTDHKDARDVQDRHIARGLPQENFAERYRRYAKSLVAVGDGAGADARQGLKIEIIAQANPYTDDLAQGLPVQVFYNDAPRANSQLEVYAKTGDAAVQVTRLRSDAQGYVTVPMEGGTEYLLDSVAIEPLEPSAQGDPVWESHWASLTFRTPD